MAFKMFQEFLTVSLDITQCLPYNLQKVSSTNTTANADAVNMPRHMLHDVSIAVAYLCSFTHMSDSCSRDRRLVMQMNLDQQVHIYLPSPVLSP